MEAELIYDNIRHYELSWEEETTREEISEINIPDAQPDVTTVLDTIGMVYIRSRDVQTGKCRVEGLIKARIVYRTEEREELQTVAAEIQFSVTLEQPGITGEDSVVPVLKLLRTETRILNSRKLQLRAEICCHASGYSAAEAVLPVDTGYDDVELRRETVALELVSACISKTFVTTDELTLPAASPTVDALVGYRFESRFEGIGQVAGKLLLKGTHEIILLYTSAGSTQVHMERFSSPFSQLMDAPGDDTCYENVTFMPVESYLEAEAAEEGKHVFSLEIHETAVCICRTVHTADVITDAYSLHHLYQATQRTLTASCNHQCIWFRDALRTEMELPYTAEQCIYSRAESRGVTRDGNVIHLMISMHLLLQAGSGELFSVVRPFTVDHTVYSGEEHLQLSDVFLSAPEVVLNGDRADIRIPWEIRGEAWQDSQSSCVESIVVDEETPLTTRPASVVMARQGGRSLWELAKQYSSRVADIEGANPNAIESDNLLLIPHVR